jgi:PAS domain S-box-containing protein
MGSGRSRRVAWHAPESAAVRYSVAIAAALVAVGLRWLLDPWFGTNVPFITLFMAVAFVVWWAGTGPAVVTALFGAALSSWLFLPARLQALGSEGVLVLLVFLLASLLIILLGDYANRRRRETAAALLELRDREQQLELIVDALPMLISYVDRDLRYRFNNRAYHTWFGVEPRSLRGRPVPDVIGATAFARAEPEMRRALAGELTQWESELDYREGGKRRISGTYVPHVVEGDVRGFFALVEDVTERRASERARAHLAALFDSAGDAVLSKGLDGLVRSWNAGAEQLFGYPADEIIGQDATRLVPDDLKGEEARLFEQVRAGRTVQRLETERLTRDGVRVPVSVTVSPVRDAEGAVVGASMIARDITKRREALRALQRSEARFRALADNAPMLIWRADADNRGTWFNRYWLDFTGRTMEQELGYGWGESIHPEDRDRVIAYCTEHCGRREPFEMEFRMRRHDGAWRWVLDRGAPVFEGPNEEFTGYIGSSIDITERKQAVEQLAQAHKRKDEFLATLAHELRNPLAPILNAAQFLRMRPPAEDPQRSAVEIVERQARHMSRLVDDLLDVSRISRGKISLRRELLRLDLAINAAIEASRPSLEGAGHALRLALAPDVYVDGDLTRLSQVFGNLINNATKYTPAGGRIEVSLGVEGDQAVVRVRDSGIGVPPDALEQVFEMFAQVSSSTAQRHDGLGIGLHLARQLVTLHGGTITAHSAGENCGTEFQVRLPRVRAAADEPPSSRPAPDAHTGLPRLRLLLVDDSADVRRSVGMMLELDGHEVHLAHDGLQAVEAAGRLRPELVLMDIGMPQMDGYEAARRIRALPDGASFYLVALTGWGQEDDRRRAFDAGFDEHWTKPIEYDALRRVIDAARARRPQLAGQSPSSSVA